MADVEEGVRPIRERLTDHRIGSPLQDNPLMDLLLVIPKHQRGVREQRDTNDVPDVVELAVAVVAQNVPGAVWSIVTCSIQMVALQRDLVRLTHAGNCAGQGWQDRGPQPLQLAGYRPKGRGQVVPSPLSPGQPEVADFLRLVGEETLPEHPCREMRLQRLGDPLLSDLPTDQRPRA
eukprot:CAMPEP_0183559764 /NCGR_PEP_ID=MMETSP0371-20130417/92784_1 /TAXON_ID=268820 /ORGANISM="Peridinium aciculiferum, Strain PAER-2" /LENGTH=176 /DNA_ID=CAMNT_0025767729 /DNA_START=75 /DNA_END=601 /DNA_ORIENTATION=+